MIHDKAAHFHRYPDLEFLFFNIGADTDIDNESFHLCIEHKGEKDECCGMRNAHKILAIHLVKVAASQG